MLTPALVPSRPRGTHAVALDIAPLQAMAEQATLFLRSVANRDRLLVLCQLVEGERCVGDLETATGVRQPTLSQQLAVLRDEGLVATRREGKFIHYRLASGHAVQLLELLHALFCASAGNGKPSRKTRRNEARA